MFFKQRFHKSVLEGRKGKDPSDNDMLTIMVMGLMSTSKQEAEAVVY